LHLLSDIALIQPNRQEYLPVIFPGFSWHNLKPAGQAADFSQLKRTRIKLYGLYEAVSIRPVERV